MEIKILFHCVVVLNLLADMESHRSTRSTLIVNDLVDPLLETFRTKIKSSEKSVVPVNDFIKTSSVSLFGKKRDYLTIQGKNCSIRDISTVHRINDVVLVQNDDVGLTVRLKLGLDIFQFICDQYYIKLPMIKFSGKLLAEVDEIDVALEVTILHENKHCFFKIGYLHVEHLDGIKFNITGFSFLNNYVSKIARWLVKKFKKSIEKEAEQELLKVFVSTIEETKSCFAS
ncbi:uncharacterized protein LOC142328591 [Lycorma delicatula]|uniref:uncharacterized protein LOC142328591 n=1 Tax=Lycorma delicatula TaxID=130591 RepID=UPI003F5168C6